MRNVLFTLNLMVRDRKLIFIGWGTRQGCPIYYFYSLWYWNSSQRNSADWGKETQGFQIGKKEQKLSLDR